MKFEIHTSGYTYDDEKTVELYKRIGFTFDKEERGFFPTTYWRMKVDSSEIEINTLEDLLELQSKVGCELIISGGSIEIYDDYRE